MRLGIRKTFKILAPGNFLRKRVAYSLVIARLILVPVIFLAVYYLFEMGWIVDRIVNVDAPAATLAQQASIEMLEARRAERNYLLLHDASYLDVNRESRERIRQIVSQIQDLEPQDMGETQKALEALGIYEQRFGAAVAAIGQPGQGDADRIQTVVRAYEKDLNGLLRNAKLKRREQLIDELRKPRGLVRYPNFGNRSGRQSLIGARHSGFANVKPGSVGTAVGTGERKLEARRKRSQREARRLNALRGMGAEHCLRDYAGIQRVGEFYPAEAGGEAARESS